MQDNMEKRKCYKCGHDRFKTHRGNEKCAKCGSKPTKLENYTNKHKKPRQRVVAA